MNKLIILLSLLAASCGKPVPPAPVVSPSAPRFKVEIERSSGIATVYLVTDTTTGAQFISLHNGSSSLALTHIYIKK
jgi:hypothetical protein